MSFASLVSAISVPALAVEIHVKPRASSRGSVVIVGDLATVTGSDKAEVERIQRIELFPAPSGSNARMVRLREIKELLQLHEIDTHVHKVKGAVSTRILPPLKRVRPVAKSKPKMEQPVRWYVVATRPLARGDILRESDVALRQQPENELRHRRFTRRIEDVLEMELQLPVEEGTPIRSTMLRRPVLIRQNEIVTVVARSAGVQVRTEARATESGSLGDRIILRSLSNRERYPARVTGTRRAEVYATGVVVADPPETTPERGPTITARKTKP